MSELNVPRKRASTRAILGEQFREQPRPDPPLPQPIKTVQDMNHERCKAAISYADERLRSSRKVTPLTERALQLYKDTAKELLETKPDDEETRMALTANLRAFEAEFQVNAALKAVRADDLQTLQERLVAFKRLEFHARYGDYLAMFCDGLKQRSRVAETLNFEQFGGWNRYWTDIQRDLTIEPWDTYVTESAATHDPSTVKTHLAVAHACQLIGLSFEDTLNVIALYADRNSLVHISIEARIRRGEFADLASSLSRDVKQLEAIMPPHLRHLKHLYRTLIVTIIEENFEVLDMEQPQTWQAKAALRENWINERKKAEDIEAARAKRRADIAEAAAKRFKKQIEGRTLAMQAVQTRLASTNSSHLKRKASSQHPASVARQGVTLSCSGRGG